MLYTVLLQPSLVALFVMNARRCIILGVTPHFPVCISGGGASLRHCTAFIEAIYPVKKNLFWIVKAFLLYARKKVSVLISFVKKLKIHHFCSTF